MSDLQTNMGGSPAPIESTTLTSSQTPDQPATTQTAPDPVTTLLDSAQAKPAEREATKPAEGEAETKTPEPFDVTALKFAEGTTPDEATLAEAGKLFGELGLKPEQAQRLVDMQTAIQTKLTEQIASNWKTTNETWATQVKALPDFSGAKLEPALGQIATFMDRFGVPDKLSPDGKSIVEPGTKTAFAITGAGNHPAILQALYNAAKAVNEGGAVQGQPVSKPSTVPTAAQALYPNLS